jgi:hypothetical protein
LRQHQIPEQEGTPQVKGNRLRPWLRVVAGGESLMSTAGAVLLVQTARVTDLDRLLGKGLMGWRLPGAVHDPGKIVLDLAIAVALGGDCAADIALVRAQAGLFGPVASDPTVSRLIARLAEDAEQTQTAIRAARAVAREWVWRHAGPPVQAGPSGQSGAVVVDLDATLVTAHSDKESAAPTWKGGFGFHPLLGFIDHGAGGTGEPVAELLRPGNAGSNTAADHVAVLELALAQLPEQLRQPAVSRAGQGRVAVLVRTDAAGATQEFTRHIIEAGMEFSVGAYLHHFDIESVLRRIPKKGAWTPAYNAQSTPRDGAWVAEVTNLVDLSAWPRGTRLILRKERPHPGAQLRFTDVDGLRVTGLLTNTEGGQLADLELRHRRHARVEDRIRAAKDTGLRNLPFHDHAQNQIWLQITALAQDLLAWTQRLALTGEYRLAEPKRLRLRIFGVAARLIRTSRRHLLKITNGWPWTDPILTAHNRLTVLAAA